MSITLANKITISRILAVPFFISLVLYYSPQRDYFRYYALAVFLFAVISDVADGYIARTWDQQTRSGAILDPLADKMLLISSFICLYKIGVLLPEFRFPIWLVVAVISRDSILLIGSMLIYMLHGNLPLEVTKWGKASTLFQVLTVGCMLLQVRVLFLWDVTLALAVISGLDYIRSGVKVLNLSEEKLNS